MKKVLLDQVLAFTIHGRNKKANTIRINLKYELEHGMINLNYQVDHILYQIFKTILRIV